MGHRVPASYVRVVWVASSLQEGEARRDPTKEDRVGLCPRNELTHLESSSCWPRRQVEFTVSLLAGRARPDSPTVRRARFGSRQAQSRFRC